MKVVITNQVALNGGDAAILYATARIVRATLPRAEIIVLDTHPEIARKYHPEFSFRPTLYTEILKTLRNRWARYAVALGTASAALVSRFVKNDRILNLFPESLRPSLEHYWHADLVMSCGGTYFVSNYQVLPKIFDLCIATLLGRPVVLFTQSLGPFSSKHRKLLRYVFRRADLILLRDERSKRHLQDLGLNLDNVRIIHDAAFALAAPTPPKRPSESPRKIAISMRDWPYFQGKENAKGMEDYVSSIVALCAHLVTMHSAEITFLSTCQGIAEYAYDDSAVARQAVERLANTAAFDTVRVDTDFHSPEDLIALYGSYDLVIATRMHAAILALCAGTPVLPIAYEFKTVELFDNLGLGGYVVHMENIDGQRLIETFERFCKELDPITRSLPGAVAQARNSAFQAGPLLKTVLDRQETR